MNHTLTMFAYEKCGRKAMGGSRDHVFEIGEKHSTMFVMLNLHCIVQLLPNTSNKPRSTAMLHAWYFLDIGGNGDQQPDAGSKRTALSSSLLQSPLHPPHIYSNPSITATPILARLCGMGGNATQLFDAWSKRSALLRTIFPFMPPYTHSDPPSTATPHPSRLVDMGGNGSQRLDASE